MQARYNMMVGVDSFMEVVDGQEEFTPAVEIDESLFTHFDLVMEMIFMQDNVRF